jgi:hypothetical protein
MTYPRLSAPTGLPIHPGYLTQRLRLLVIGRGCRRSGCTTCGTAPATLARAAGADLKAVQDQLGHASIALTGDIYTSVLPGAQREAAEATARLVLDAGEPREDVRHQLRRGRGTSQEPVVVAQKPQADGCPPRWRPSLAAEGSRRRAVDRRRLGRAPSSG